MSPAAEGGLFCNPLTSTSHRRYTSKDGATAHTKTENFKALMENCEKEGVMGKEPYLVFTKTIGGYDWDRQKI